MKLLLKYLKGLTYASEPDYDYIYSLFESIAFSKDETSRDSVLMDWQSESTYGSDKKLLSKFNSNATKQDYPFMSSENGQGTTEVPVAMAAEPEKNQICSKEETFKQDSTLRYPEGEMPLKFSLKPR
jgi:hypothetical protein